MKSENMPIDQIQMWMKLQINSGNYSLKSNAQDFIFFDPDESKAVAEVGNETMQTLIEYCRPI